MKYTQVPEPRIDQLKFTENPRINNFILVESGKCEIIAGGDPPKQIPAPSTPAKDNAYQETSRAENIETLAPENVELPPPDTKLSKLEVFQEKQKMIEEQNRKRKEMLSKAIKDRKQKTDSESKKLELVRQELEKIDLMLNTDVQFLRGSIEQASVEFMEAQ